jgi:uncharacterized integral membrane protein (TIGR00698 family)
MGNGSRPLPARLAAFAERHYRGVFITLVIAVSAKFISEHYGAPAMLMALLLGIAVQFLHEDEKVSPGIEFSATSLLRLGVALLGLRISAQLLTALGYQMILIVVAGVAMTILLGYGTARLLRHSGRFGILSGGAVAICGVSAAMAIAAVLPKNEHSERNLTFTVISVTVLSTIAMILYPIVVDGTGMNERLAGVFLGGTIHDVAQVVGAGYSVSDETGDVATVVKLIRVSLLAPVIFCISLIVGRVGSQAGEGADKHLLLPWFVWAFLALAVLSSTVHIPAAISAVVGEGSRWLLLTAVAAVGMKTSLRQVRDVGGQAIALLVIETLALALFVLLAIFLIGPA